MSGDNPTNSDLARMLGGIQANQDNIRREFERERDDAALHRRALRETVGAMGEAIRTLTTRMTEISPLVDSYRETRDQAIGAARLGKLMWATLLGVSAFFGAILAKIFDHFK